MSLAQRMKNAKLLKIAVAKDEAHEAELARAEEASSTPAPASIFESGDMTSAPFTRPANSVAQRARQGKLARQAVEAADGSEFAPERDWEGDGATEYDLLMAQLGEDMRRLKGIQSSEGKIAAKREMIDAYTPHVDATLAAAIDTDQAVQDELLVNIMIWRLDIGDYDRGLDIAEHVLRYRLRLPERFQRTPGTLIAELVAEAALTASKADRDFPIPVITRTAQLTDDFDMPDAVRAKLMKAYGMHLVRAAEAADKEPDSVPAGAAISARKAALEAFRRALQLDGKAGVIKDIERLVSRLNKAGRTTDEGEQTPQE